MENGHTSPAVYWRVKAEEFLNLGKLLLMSELEERLKPHVCPCYGCGEAREGYSLCPAYCQKHAEEVVRERGGQLERGNYNRPSWVLPAIKLTRGNDQ